MNLYTRKLFPKLMDASLASEEMTNLRRDLLSGVHGKILEIGVGTGLNLSLYPDDVKGIDAVDVHPQMLDVAMERARLSGLDVRFYPISAETLPFADASFDSIVSTWTMCSITDLPKALSELQRVLKPDGRLFFVEHGLSPDYWVSLAQHWLNPLQKALGGGCNLNRDIPSYLKKAGFIMEGLRTLYLQKALRFEAYTYIGQARKES